jgi:hypothetical protein
MMQAIRVSLLCLVFVSGCATDSAQSDGFAQTPLMDQSVPQVARAACLREVGRTTNNPDLAIIEMIYSEANSQLKVGVGPDRAPWRCLVSNSGIVAEVMSLTDEGAL